jgi:hypothetical protein
MSHFPKGGNDNGRNTKRPAKVQVFLAGSFPVIAEEQLQACLHLDLVVRLHHRPPPERLARLAY